MKFEQLLAQTQQLSCWRPKDLCLPASQMHNFRIQLCRWIKSNKVMQIKRGLYTLTDIYRKTPPPGWRDVFDKIRPGARVGGLAALSYYGVVPEQVFQGVAYLPAKGRAETIHFKIEGGTGQIQYKPPPPFPEFGCLYINNPSQPGTAFLSADLERALLDVALEEKECGNPQWIESMRFHYEDINAAKLIAYARKTKKNRLVFFAQAVENLCREERWEELK